MALRAAWRGRLLRCGKDIQSTTLERRMVRTDTESTATYRVGMQSGAEVRWFTGQPLIAVRNQLCTWPGLRISAVWHWQAALFRQGMAWHLWALAGLDVPCRGWSSW